MSVRAGAGTAVGTGNRNRGGSDVVDGHGARRAGSERGSGQSGEGDWRVRPAGQRDVPFWAALRSDLWPEGSVEEHRSELGEWLGADGTLSLVAESDGELLGFLEGRLRSHADGCGTSPVAYLEGWYVAPPWRRKGVGRALVASFEGWARDSGCRELASDTWPENEASITAHRRLGFQEVDRLVTFRKCLETDIDVPPSARPPLTWEDS